MSTQLGRRHYLTGSTVTCHCHGHCLRAAGLPRHPRQPCSPPCRCPPRCARRFGAARLRPRARTGCATRSRLVERPPVECPPCRVRPACHAAADRAAPWPCLLAQAQARALSHHAPCMPRRSQQLHLEANSPVGLPPLRRRWVRSLGHPPSSSWPSTCRSSPWRAARAARAGRHGRSCRQGGGVGGPGRLPASSTGASAHAGRPPPALVPRFAHSPPARQR